MFNFAKYAVLFFLTLILFSCSLFQPLNTTVVLEIDTEALAKNGELKEDYSTEVERACEVLRMRLKKLKYSSSKVIQQEDNTILLKLPQKMSKRGMDVLLSNDVLEFYPLHAGSSSYEYRKLAHYVEGIAKTIDDSSASLLSYYYNGMEFPDSSKVKITKLLTRSDVKAHLNGVQLLWGKDPVVNRYGTPSGKYNLYLLDAKPAMTGEAIKSAKPMVDEQFGGNSVNFTFTPKGAKEFAQITDRFKGEQLAIVVGKKVFSAPHVREKITGGAASISGDFTKEEAKDLAIVLSSGGISLPLKVVSVTEK